MTDTTVLYTLSTLAQTCAALAAFVGAVGVFRLQILREQRREVDQIRRLRLYTIQRPDGGWDGTPAGFERPIRNSRIVLILFEVWNVGLIAASLIGFNYISTWAGAGWLSCALWGVAAGTAGVTLSCVYVWTRRVEQ
jgi:hypothetical protein